MGQPEPARLVFWREEDKSFLPALDEATLSQIIESGLRRHIEGVSNGTIRPLRTILQDQMKGRRSARPNADAAPHPDARNRLSDWDSMQLLSADLRRVYGNWISPSFCYHALHAAFYQPRGCLLSFLLGHRSTAFRIDARDLETARVALVNAVRDRHSEVNRLLIELNRTSSSEMTTQASADVICEAVARLVELEHGASGTEERWFDSVPEKTAIYLESVGCFVPVEQIDDIADKHFSSWVDPETDTVAQFADEIAAISVKQRFWEKYGKPAP